MNKASHVILGNFLCERLKYEYGIHLNKENFLLGNILPDISAKFLIKPHILKNYHMQIKRLIQNMLDEEQTSVFSGKRFSRNLGIICHYYADFFCYPHNSKYTGDIASHFKYERDLFLFLAGGFLKNDEASDVHYPTQEATAEIIFERFKSLHDTYIENMPSFYNDISYSLTACTEALILIISTALIEQMNEYQLCYPA